MSGRYQSSERLTEERMQQSIREEVQRLLPDDLLKRIITHNSAEASQSLDKAARRIGESIHRHITTSQIRNIFGIVRMIEQDTRGLEAKQPLPPAVVRELVMLRPKLAYQYGRIRLKEHDKKRAMGVMTTILSDAISLVGDSQGNFRNFVDFFEAILAYHRYFGGQATETRS